MTKSIQKFFPIIIATLIAGMMPACTKDVVEQAWVAPRHPFPVQMRYPDALTVPDHISPEKQHAVVRRVYDRWKSNYLSVVRYPFSSRKDYRITAGKKRAMVTFSEGQGYGLILTAYMAGHDSDARTIFDGLYRFSRRHPSRIEPRFMTYKVPDTRSRRTSAFDGDADIAFALLLADQQWGSNGTINYRQEATELINTLADKVLGMDSHLPMLGDWVSQEGEKYNQHTVRSSDLMAGHFKTFKMVSDTSVWETAVHKSQTLIDFLQSEFSPESGLVPDFIIKGAEGNPMPAPANFLESRYDGDYYYNAARVPWRLAEDGLLWEDPGSLAQLQKMATWILAITNGDPARIGPGFQLDGTPLDNGDYMSMAFIGPFGLAAMTLKDQQNFVNRVFELCAGVEQDYYEDTISLFSLLLMTGNYWLPAAPPSTYPSGSSAPMGPNPSDYPEPS